MEVLNENSLAPADAGNETRIRSWDDTDPARAREAFKTTTVRGIPIGEVLGIEFVEDQAA